MTNLVFASFYTRNRLRIIFGVVVIILLAAIVFAKSTAQASLNQDQAALGRALSVETMTLQAVDHYQVQQQYSGNIVAGRESDHGFDKAGLLAEVLVDDGDRVKKGDILARLDTRRFEARKKELDAELAEAVALNHETTARLGRAQATYDRYQILVDKKHVSRQKFDEVKFDLAALKARIIANESAVARSKAALNSLEVDRDLAFLTARFDGSVVRRYQDEGTALGSGAAVIRLIEDKKLEIQVGLPQSAAFALMPGETYFFTYQGQKIRTQLRSVLNKVDSATRTVTAIFDVAGDSENIGANIWAGGLAQLAIDTSIQQAGFWLPTGALAESRRGLWSVYSLKSYRGSTEYGTLFRQELQILYTDSDRVFVRGTLQDGQRIVSGGLHRLVPGQLVRVSEGE